MFYRFKSVLCLVYLSEVLRQNNKKIEQLKSLIICNQTAEWQSLPFIILTLVRKVFNFFFLDLYYFFTMLKLLLTLDQPFVQINELRILFLTYVYNFFFNR